MSRLDAWRREGWLREVDHAFADTLRRLRPDTPEPVLLAAGLASHALAFGHSQWPLAQAAALFADIDTGAPPPDTPAAAAWAEAVAASPWSAPGGPLVFDGETLALRRYWQHETDIAGRLRALAAVPPPLTDPNRAAWREARLRALFPALADDAGDAQAAAARALLETRLLLLTGGPGTGKTTTVARALVLQVEGALRDGRAPPRIALAAPTGKAAARLAESLRDNLAALRGQGRVDDTVAAALPTEAATLHRLLGAGAPRCEVLVVDEASMVDLPLMARLLAALPAPATLLLVGDPGQLPSVDTGDVLAALCAAEPPLPRVHLHRVHRQSEGNAVGALAAAVQAGETEAVLARLAGQGYAGVAWQPGRDRALAAAVRSAALPAYREVQAAATPAQALARARDFRVLTALREGPSGSETLNALLADALRPPGARAERLFPGALLMVTRNSPRHGLFNGDIGVAWPDEGGALRVWFDTGEPDGPRAWLPAALPAHEFAFALTVHKAQGSEFGTVFLALPERGARVLSRELLYTGLTRCRDGVELWASEAALREGIARRVQRWSGLAARLSDAAQG